MPRDFTIPSINQITSSYGSSTDKPIILGVPGILSVKQNIPYKIIVDKNE